MSQRQQLERVFEIDRQIRTGHYPNADSLAQELEVSRRVIFNDRKFLLERLGAPLAFDRERGGWFYTEPTWTLPVAVISEGELLALFLGVEAAQRSMGTAFEAPLRRALAKVAQSTHAQVSVDLNALRQHYTFTQPAAVSTDATLLLALDGAITSRRAVRIRYYTASRGEKSERIVHPHHLHNVEGDWHLFAFDRKREEMRTFNVGRIEAWTVLDTGFVREPGFNAEAMLRSMFGSEEARQSVQVTVRFDAYQARYIRERRWHPTQEVEELPDGGLVLRFMAGGLNEVRRWVMRYGCHAEVLAPEELRTAVAQEAEQMVQMYR